MSNQTPVNICDQVQSSPIPYAPDHRLQALEQSSTLHGWEEVIAEAVRKMNSANNGTKLAPY